MPISDAELESRLARAAELIASAEALLVGAGAGMGVDSGLPDFRGNEGFWKAYPPFRGRIFAEMSNPTWFRRDPELAWGFFGHRQNLYREATPHSGYAILKRWMSDTPHGGFDFTSNVDGQFQKAGFDPQRLLECHGAIDRLQCIHPCQPMVWQADNVELEINLETIRTPSPLPRCPHCNSLARPNILMFGDSDWISDIADAQAIRLSDWLQTVRGRRLIAVECGAGMAIPTVRRFCEQTASHLIRINPRDDHVPATGIGIPLGAAQALSRIEELMHGGR